MGEGEHQNQSWFNKFSNPLLSGRDSIKMSLPQEMIETLRTQWKKLWQERLDDKLRVEGIATRDYPLLYIDKGTIIHATRNFKALNFREILEQHQIAHADRFISLNPEVGGWTKFIKTNVTNKHPRKNRPTVFDCGDKKKKLQPKGSRGWLHL
jgi:hypothetical protein